MNVILWILQVLFALLFIWAGGFKLVVPASVMAAQTPPGQIALSGAFLKFIGLCELVGGFGLILPGIFKTKQYLIPLAALGLLIIMIGATVVVLTGGNVAVAVSNTVIALLLAFVAYGRWRLKPLG
ncbi:MAG TPA: DoxX family protein [Pyrinomonadaceae bacterium]|nr:DoxX family protein [Pyrinomonadaceae bacterium]